MIFFLKTEDQLAYNKIYYPRNKERILENNKIYRIAHREEIKAKSKIYREKNKDFIVERRLGSGKRWFCGISKRILPVDRKCELCKSLPKRLEYHHWDDSDLRKGFRVKGLWLCRNCHAFLTNIEKKGGWRLASKIFERYLKLKVEIDHDNPNIRYRLDK